MDRVAFRVLARYLSAGGLQDVTKLRWQAVFLMGAGGSGKGFYGHKWMKYMPGAPPEGYSRAQFKQHEHDALTQAERGLSNLNFTKAVAKLKDKGFEVTPTGNALMPFKLYKYPPGGGREVYIPPQDYKKELPPDILRQVIDLKEVVFGSPKHEVPNYWRQVNPDIYKEELAGYLARAPGFVHEMSSEMSKAYFDAILETGDPLFVDGTGKDPVKMLKMFNAAKSAGYKTSVVFVYVPLTINHIRNATRARNVSVEEVNDQWSKIQDSYFKIKGSADLSKLVDNRSDGSDIMLYKTKGDQIDTFIKNSTGGKYQNLYELIADKSPKELSAYGKLLKRDTADEDAKFEKWLKLMQRQKPKEVERRAELDETGNPKKDKSGHVIMEKEEKYLARMWEKFLAIAGQANLRNAGRRSRLRRLWAV